MPVATALRNRRLIRAATTAGLIGLFVIAACAADEELATPKMYLLAATPTVYRGVGYPATLYSIDAKQKLQLERQVVPGTQGVEFVVAGTSFLAVGYPNGAAASLAFVHYEDPKIADTTSFGARVSANPLEAFLLEDRSAGQIVGLNCVINGISCLFGVRVHPAGPTERVLPQLSWVELEGIHFQGSIGGADIGLQVTIPTLGGQGLYVYSPQGLAFIARVKTPPVIKPETPATLQAANNQFVIATRNATDASAPNSTVLWVYNRQLKTASSMPVIGTRNRYRIFGHWLTVVVSYYGLGPGASDRPTEIGPGTVVINSNSDEFDPGEDQQRAVGTADFPPTRLFYQHPAVQQWFPGKLLVVNLLTGDTVAYDTGQADSEVLCVDDQRVLFRVNDQIYSTRLSQGTFDKPILLVKDEDVPEIHWVFY